MNKKGADKFEEIRDMDGCRRYLDFRACRMWN